ncbi:MAG: hypothetical protein H0X39_00850 [Actinobacteria bacterium]|nr:hypothetical protein [Actinomycetota bacterium]
MPTPSIIDHGIPVSVSRQFTTALSRNAANTGWNYISGCFDGGVGVPVEWAVVSNLTGTAPVTTLYNTTTHLYPSLLYQYTNQLRAANGRIFFPLFGPSTAYYDPTDEQIHELAQITESPAQNPDASTTFYSAIFDTAGLLYMGTQESANRPACIVVTNPTTLAQTIIGYVGDSNAAGFTTYAYRLAPDTSTSSKWIYVAFGQNPWQLWALNITTGTATKLYEVTSTGNIQFVDIVGQGWTAIIDTALGQPNNVRTQSWCLDGAMYTYTAGGSPPVTGRNVTPQSNPLTGTPPQLDIDGGAGKVGWRAGSTGAYTYVNYALNYVLPVAIESLVASLPNSGVIGNTSQYSGFFQDVEPAGTVTWYGVWTNTAVSQGPRLNVGGTVYIAGYPNGVLFKYDPSAAWNSNGNVNPILIGYYGLNGTQFAGIKYANALAWGASAGTTGRLYCSGDRERNGTGLGVGYWDKSLGSFAGTYAATGMTAVIPSGIVASPKGQSPSVVVLDGISRVVFSTLLLSGSGSAPLYVFDYDLNYITQVTPLAGVANLGNIYKSSTASVITGIVQGSGNKLGLYKYNVQTQALVTYTEIAITGTLGASCQRPNGDVWITSGSNLVAVDINGLTATVVQDLSAIGPIVVSGFASDGHTLFMAAGPVSDVSGARLYSVETSATTFTPAAPSSRTFDRSFASSFDIDYPTGSFDSSFDSSFDRLVGLAGPLTLVPVPGVDVPDHVAEAFSRMFEQDS